MKTDNELIAEFMGEKIELINGVWYMPENISFEGQRIECHNYLRYDTSWDWLMPVVEKIKQIYNDEEDIAKSRRIIDQTIFKISAVMPRETIYNAVLSFIKWYNQQKQ